MTETSTSPADLIPDSDQAAIIKMCELIARLYLIRTEFEVLAGTDASFSNAIGESIGCCTEVITNRIEHSGTH